MNILYVAKYKDECKKNKNHPVLYIVLCLFLYEFSIYKDFLVAALNCYDVKTAVGMSSEVNQCWKSSNKV